MQGFHPRRACYYASSLFPVVQVTGPASGPRGCSPSHATTLPHGVDCCMKNILWFAPACAVLVFVNTQFPLLMGCVAIVPLYAAYHYQRNQINNLRAVIRASRLSNVRLLGRLQTRTGPTCIDVEVER